MKKTKSIILSTVICTLLFLTGCDKGLINSSSGFGNAETGNSNSYVGDEAVIKGEISDIGKNFSKDIESLKNNKYDNLSFNDTVFSPPPQINYVSELTLMPLTGKSSDEIYDFFSESVDILTGKKYTDEEKKHEIRFADAKPDENKPYPYNFPNIDEYKNGNETDYPVPVIDDKEYYIDMMCGALRGFDNGDLIEHDHSDHPRRSMYFMIYQNPKHHPVFYTEDLTCTDTYRLVNGEISIADAAKFVQNYLDELKFTPYDGSIPKPRIFAVNVVDIGEGSYGYNFLTTVEYNSVFFDHYDSKGNDFGMTGVLTDYDKRMYNSLVGSIDMIETDGIHRFLDITRGVEVVEGEQTTEIITLKSAADSVSYFFSGHMKFSVQEVEIVWLPTNDSNEYVQQAYPCWKFKMYANGEIYHTFVDVITGEIHLYVQAVK